MSKDKYKVELTEISDQKFDYNVKSLSWNYTVFSKSTGFF